MRLPRVRFTVRTMMVTVAVVGVLMVWSYDWSARRERCFDIASRHASLAAEYRRNARADQGMLRIATWHDYMKQMFVSAANRPWEPIPKSSPFPPPGW
jgi:hypothetical protein